MRLAAADGEKATQAADVGGRDDGVAALGAEAAGEQVNDEVVAAGDDDGPADVAHGAEKADGRGGSGLDALGVSGDARYAVGPD